ncbi:MAG: hypothetical protein MJZ00_03650 [Paludibacteraceae bacterium]|nr:hypothetical protein [Paludibacteraceae bacterium]
MKKINGFVEKFKCLSKVRIKCIILSFILIVVTISFQIASTRISFTDWGEVPNVGLLGFLLLFLIGYLCFEFELLFLKRNFGVVTILVPVLFVLGYCEIYNMYSKKIYMELMSEKNVVTGVVYDRRASIGKGNNQKIVIVGYGQKYKFNVPVSDYTYNNTNVGDTIILYTSRMYPGVMDVLKWNPTKEEIERYNEPRKLRGYINGNIFEEE